MAKEEKREDGIEGAIAKNDGFDDTILAMMMFAALDSCRPLLLQTILVITIVVVIVAAGMRSTVSRGGRNSFDGNGESDKGYYIRVHGTPQTLEGRTPN